MHIADMAGLLRELGLDYIKDRRLEVWASCPGHHDSGDSWSINKQTGLHSCFACPTRGDIYGLILQVKPNYSMRQAQALIEKYGVELMDAEQLEEFIEEPYKPIVPLTFNAKLRYHNFTEAPDKVLVDRFVTREAVNHYGVKWKEPNTWILPIKSPAGSLMGWQEKGSNPGGMSRTLPVGVKKSSTLFGAEHLPQDLIVLVESPLDAVRLWGIGYFAVASFGASVSDEQMRLLVGADVILCLDNDEAGKKWTWDVLTNRQVNWSARLKLRIADYGALEGKDVGELEDNEIVEMLISSSYVLDWMRENKRPENNAIQGRTKTVPGNSRRANGRAKETPRRLTNGAGKNRLHHSSSRKSY